MNAIKIKELAEDVYEKEKRYQILGTINTHIDPELRKQQRVEYVIAETEMIEARQALRAEQGL